MLEHFWLANSETPKNICEDEWVEFLEGWITLPPKGYFDEQGKTSSQAFPSGCKYLKEHPQTEKQHPFLVIHSRPAQQIIIKASSTDSLFPRPSPRSLCLVLLLVVFQRSRTDILQEQQYGIVGKGRFTASRMPYWANGIRYATWNYCCVNAMKAGCRL